MEHLKGHFHTSEENVSPREVVKPTISELDQTEDFVVEMQESPKTLLMSELTEKETETISHEGEKLSELQSDILPASPAEDALPQKLLPELEQQASSSSPHYSPDIKDELDVSSVVNADPIVAESDEPSQPPPPLPHLTPPPIPSPPPPPPPPPPEENEDHENDGDNSEVVANDDQESAIAICDEQETSTDVKEKEEMTEEVVDCDEKKDDDALSESCKDKEEVGHQSMEMKVGPQSTETLDELESFLSQLKENKKQQMIAEGKSSKWKKL